MFNNNDFQRQLDQLRAELKEDIEELKDDVHSSISKLKNLLIVVVVGSGILGENTGRIVEKLGLTAQNQQESPAILATDNTINKAN